MKAKVNSWVKEKETMDVSTDEATNAIKKGGEQVSRVLSEEMGQIKSVIDDIKSDLTHVKSNVIPFTTEMKLSIERSAADTDWLKKQVERIEKDMNEAYFTMHSLRSEIQDVGGRNKTLETRVDQLEKLL